MSPEVMIVSAFVISSRRSRYLSILESKQGRNKFRAKLAHFHDFDPRFIRHIPPIRQNSKDIEAMLRSLGAPNKCFVISEADEIDASEADLRGALDMIIGHGFGTILSCLHGYLAFYESEESGERFILRRHHPSTRE